MGLTTTTNDRRFNLDEIDERMKDLDRQELAAMGIDPDKAPVVVTPDPAAELARLRDENEKMRALIERALEARTRARDFMAIWSDPRKLPDLAQEVYLSHPNIALVRTEINEEAARRAARLIAHLAVTYEIHPLIAGMIYAWPDGGKVCVEIGYRGYLEMVDRRQDLDYDGPHDMTPDQRALHKLGSEDRGAVCYVWDWAKKRRFEMNDKTYTPSVGIGVWQEKNRYGRRDNVANGRSPQWQAEKNAIKDAARRALSFAIVRTADLPDIVDLAYDGESDMWTLPAPVADWLNNAAMLQRFESLLAADGITSEEFNAYLGHNWRYTPLSPEEIKGKLDAYLNERRAAAIQADQVFEPATSPVAPTLEADPAPVADTPAETPVDAPTPTVEAPPAETPTPAKTKKTAAPKTVMCANCKVEPAVETPLGSAYCATCASKLADSKAAES